jgi:ubiquinone/menaquinone biosynthesis C-methylase UbiE
MDHMRKSENVKQQYANSDNLNIRSLIHAKYSVNKQGFRNWLNDQYDFWIGCRILELGCGNGDMWMDKIKQLGSDSTLILSDFSEGMVEEVRKKYDCYENILTQQINIEDIPYEDLSFDIVIANMMLYHVPDLEKALSEVARVLKPGGKFYSATYGENGIHNYILITLNTVGMLQEIPNSFTLQNGAQILREYFNSVIKEEYMDHLEITDTKDLLDYVYSMESVIPVKREDRARMFELFEKKKDENGRIIIPKEYGMFISAK